MAIIICHLKSFSLGVLLEAFMRLQHHSLEEICMDQESDDA